MAPRTNRPKAGLLVCLADPLPDRSIPATRCVDPSCGTIESSDDPIRRERYPRYSGRLPRFTLLAKRLRSATGRADSPNDAMTPTKTPVTDRPIKERVS